jgi:hypothetical protein
MHKKEEPEKNREGRFTESELQTLRDIVVDWLNEEIQIPPYSEDLESILRKLDVNETQLSEVPSRSIKMEHEEEGGGVHYPMRPNVG